MYFDETNPSTPWNLDSIQIEHFNHSMIPSDCFQTSNVQHVVDKATHFADEKVY